MASVVLVGTVVVLVGLASSSVVIVAVGALIAALAAAGFLVPGFRDVRDPQRVDRESYVGFVAGVVRDTTEHPGARSRDRREADRPRPEPGAEKNQRPDGKAERPDGGV